MPFGVAGGDQVTVTWYGLTASTTTSVGGVSGTTVGKKY